VKQYRLQATSPACTELEVIVMDWLAKLLGLPKEFLACSGGPGGGVIQVSICNVMARDKKKY
jgi:glutamate/tyrosine decarboxylase-like PLP-dependent enzyme